MGDMEKLQDIISKAKHLVAFTGAGISAESGIPTYRGNDGVWQKYDPSMYANINYFHKDPSYYWNFFKDVRYPGLQQAEPNNAHLTLAKLEENGILKAVITQNIDGLHELAGSNRVLELHGNTRRIICLSCQKQFSIHEAYDLLQSQIPPLCPECGGLLKPDVVLFGESLPMHVLEVAREESIKSDVFLSIGSSLVVQPAASLPAMAKERGSQLIIVNKESTPLDIQADIVFYSSASEVLSALTV